MKTLALLLLLAGGSAALADSDALQNSDFSDGLSHWEGDVHTAGSSVDDSNSTTGVVVKLRGDWTKIGQDFDGKAGTYILTIAYTVTPDISFSQNPDDYANVTGGMELDGLRPISTQPGQWAIMVVDSGISRYHYWRITPTLTTGVQTIKAQVQLASGDDYKKGFWLGFPPGTGTVNLQSITLVPYGTDTASAQ